MARHIPPISRTGQTANPLNEQPFGFLETGYEVSSQAESQAAQEPRQSEALTTLPAIDYADALGTPRDVMSALTYGLELVRCGAMLVAFEGRPQLANRAARAILEKKDGIALARTGLIADRASDTRLLQELLKQAILVPERGEPQGSPISLPRRSARTSLIVRVVPGPGLDCWPGAEHRTALMTMSDEDTGLQIDESVLCKLYGLTRGEAGLAAILIQGKSIEEAAAALFISPHTARTHLKRIFMKTDTHRQTELVVRIFSAVL